jgi:hypothetical protein
MRAYFSYPALYTHKRNKHNIIPITGKQDIFKNYTKDVGRTGPNTNFAVKYKYSAVENINEGLNYAMNSIKSIYADTIKDLFCKEGSLLFKNGYDQNSHEGYKLLKLYEDGYEATTLNSGDSGNILQKKKIDDVLVLYLINFFKVTGQISDLNKLVVKFVILFREYLNIVGWDYKKNFIKYNVAVPFSLNGSYTQCNECEDLPDLINDFISVFIQMEPNMFDLNLKEFMDIIKNFYNWLFVNNLTNFKITENEFDTHLL